jgi:hypothetical protein
VAFSQQANSTDWVTAIGRRILVPTFADRELSRGQRGWNPTAVNLNSLDRNRYFSFSSSSFIITRLSEHRSRPTSTQKMWYRREWKPGPLSLQAGTLTTRQQRRSINIRHLLWTERHWAGCLRVLLFPVPSNPLTVKNGVFWDVTPYGSCNNRRFGGT